MTEYLLAISLGPVQDFIAAARKTRDLWAGSEMLSGAARAAARALQENGATLIFPSPNALADGAAGVANKLLARVGGNPPRLVEAARSAASAYVQRRADAALAFRDGLPVDEPLMKAQVADFLEVFAAWVPCTQTYAEDRRAVERLLAGRKALRDFKPAPGRAGIAKSALDPSRESVIDWPHWDKNVSPPRGIRYHEHLDGLSLIKRLAPSEHFVSVSRIAVDPLIRRLAAEEPASLAELGRLAEGLRSTGAAERFQGFSRFDAFPFDTELFYGNDDPVPPERQGEVDRFHAVLCGARRRVGLGEPPAYYAVLVADGDHMGRLIDGQNTVEEHQRLSDELVRFAGEAARIVETHSGALVYSGGDDVLAFLPLDTALGCADELRQTFSRRIQGTSQQAATLTVGLALVHYHESLADALTWAREEERAGKQERNCLAVGLHTRSGGQVTRTASSWETNPVPDRWNRWVDLYREDALPDGAAYELRSLAAELAGIGGRPDIGDVVLAEVGRILSRKRAAHGERRMLAAHVEALVTRLNAGASTAEGLEDLAHELIIARRIAEVTAVADGAGGGLGANGRP